MIQLKIKYYFIFIFLCGQFLINPVSAVNTADSLYWLGEYDKAAIEYERVVYYSTDYRTTNNARFMKAMCYKNLQDYTKGLKELQQLNYAQLSDSLQAKYRYQTSLLAYLSGEFMLAESIFKQLETFIADTTLIQDIWLIRALNYNELTRYEKAYASGQKYILKAVNDDKQSWLASWDSLYNKKSLPHLKNNKLANVLQMVPGLGLIYAGAWGEGMFNFLLNATFLGFGVYQVLEGYYITGYFSAAIPINKFYFGGHKRTQFLLKKHNYEQIIKFNQEAKRILLHPN